MSEAAFLRLVKIVEQVEFPSRRIVVHAEEGRFYLQLEFEADGQTWHSRKWLLSPHMTSSEVVQTALKAILTSVEHEAREHFTYRGRKVFGPHIDVEQLWTACETLDVRNHLL